MSKRCRDFCLETSDEMIAAGLKLIGRDRNFAKRTQLLIDFVKGKFNVFFIDIGADDKVTFMLHADQGGMNAIGQTFLFADVFHEPRPEISPENMCRKE